MVMWSTMLDSNWSWSETIRAHYPSYLGVLVKNMNICLAIYGLRGMMVMPFYPLQEFVVTCEKTCVIYLLFEHLIQIQSHVIFGDY